ncbi:MAG: LPS biosynthesis protein [Clostridiales Family XIII bacterium]|jgi:hypothetical protein|nr:LPS biosynthesis protein [Clostridiales Family XIII bacterium]
MKIQDNEIVLAAVEAFRRGDKPEGRRIQHEFIVQYHEEYDGKDHCPCTAPCRYHNNCEECVVLHRAHLDHLPICMHPIVNRKLYEVSQLSEHSITEFIAEKQKEQE